MSIPYIYHWFNGMGNQLLTMINAIYFTFYFKKFKKLDLPNNSCFNTKNFPTFETNELSQESEERFDITRRINPCSDWFCLGIKEMKDIYLKHIDYKFIEDIKKIEHDIGIHIRSGDIFGGNVHWEYVQPPLDYYINIINKNPSKSIIIVHDTNPRKPHWKNPVIDKLIEYINENKLQNVKIQSKSMREDMKALICSKTIICAMGTFSLMCYFISPFVKKIVIPHYMHKKLRGKNWFVLKDEDNEFVQVVNFPKYIKVGSWKNKEEQRNLMVEYKMSKEEVDKLLF